MNGVQDSVTVLLGEIEQVPRKEFDLVAANIQRGVIERILPEMRLRLNASGHLLLSGLLDVDREPILASLDAQRLHVVDELRDKEWLALAAVHLRP
jgi:ribosomal protein L11 methyltransferase